ncbi:MAG: bacterial Ig-like protein [Paenibacillus sp.]|nr:bacterial Ig-like protein [Paenibacillus sp.]
MSIILLASIIIGVPFTGKARADTGAELIVNGGFESVAGSVPAHWTQRVPNLPAEVVTSIVYGGTNSVKLTDANAASGLGLRSAKVPVVSGQVFNASVYAYAETGTATLYLEYWDSSNQVIKTDIQSMNDLNQWKRIEKETTAPVGAKHLTLTVYSSIANVGTIYYDNASLKRTAPASTIELIANGGFENIVDGIPEHWTQRVPVLPAEVATSSVYAGLNSVKLTDASAASGLGLRSAKVPVTPGQVFAASVYAYAETGTATLYLEYWDSSNQVIKTDIKSASDVNQWKKIEMETTAPTGALHLSLTVYSSIANVGTIYYDNASLRETAPPPSTEKLVNGDFETLTNGFPENWTQRVPSIPAVVATNIVYDGVRSMKLVDTSATSGLGFNSAKIPVVTGEEYIALVYAYVESGAATLYVEYWNSSNQVIKTEIKSLTELNQWKKMLSITKAPVGATHASLTLYASVGNVGTAYYDNASFKARADAVLENIVLSSSLDEVAVSQDAWIAVKGTMSDDTSADLSGEEIRYSSSNSGVLAVNAKGRMRGVAVGTAVVTVEATLNGVTKSSTLTFEVKALTSFKTRSTLYTSAKISAARDNVAQYEWAAALKNSAVSIADVYIAKGWDYLWKLVPPQSLPRSYRVSLNGSPVTGHDIDQFGNYPYKRDPLDRPWKIYDPSSGLSFPTNDFGAFYISGLNEYGIFDPDLADRSLLVNTLYPERGPTWGVDDGTGWVDQNGNRYTFIAYYTHWNLWSASLGGGGTGAIIEALNAFRDAYLYTGDMKYARAGVILLDRVADIYPSLDIAGHDTTIYINSDGGRKLGGALGSIWEPEVVKSLVRAYDAFFPAIGDSQIIQFLSGKGAQYDLSLKTSATGIKRNIEDGIIKKIFPRVKDARILGNNGMHQSALATAAVVFDTLPETGAWLDFLFQSGSLLANPWRLTGGNIEASFINSVDRDGYGNEGSPGYNSLWITNYLDFANVMDGYDLYPQGDLYNNPRFRKMFLPSDDLMLLEKYTANIGDNSSTGNPGLVFNKMKSLRAFEKFSDPLDAQLAYFYNHNRSDNLHGDIFSADANELAANIEDVIQTHGQLNLPSVNLTGYGFAALRDGEREKLNFGTYFGVPFMTVGSQTQEATFTENSSTLTFQGKEIGDRIEFSFEVTTANNYELLLKSMRNKSSGIYEIEIDGVSIGQIDFTETEEYPETLTTLNLTAGVHTIAFECIGKNAASSDYKLFLTSLVLLNPQEQTLKASIDWGGTLRAAWLYYGRNYGHAQSGAMNLGIHAYNLDLTPELGYPQFAEASDAHNWEWTSNTISHNTVVVDKAKQSRQWVGIPKHYDDGEIVKLIDVESPDVYAQTELYKRTTAMVRVDDTNSYTIDFFRIKGGNDHHFSFHGAEGTVATSGLNLTPQSSGSYAGANVEYGDRPVGDSVSGINYKGSGFHWLKNVSKDVSPANQFSVDWDIVDTWKVFKQEEDTHLRLTMLGNYDEIALADGIPPQNKPGNPESLRYLIAHRSGTNLDSLFTSVIEPYVSTRYVQSITAIPVKQNGIVVTDNSVKAVKIELISGRTDYVVSAMNPGILYTIDDKLQFQGFFGVYSEVDDEPVYAYVNDGTTLGKLVSPTINAAVPRQSGTVVSFTTSLQFDNEIAVQMNLNGMNPQLLVGRTLYIENDNVRNAAYVIKGIMQTGTNQYKLDIGDITLIRSYVNANDFTQGFVYDISVDAAFNIPLSQEVVVF